ncbi:MAG: trimethylamine methyltransferase family protein [Phycisphaerae bacterium]
MKLEVLGLKGVARIDQAARRILSRTGVLVPHEKMLKLFAKAGAAVDGERVRIPDKLVTECVRAAGKSFTIYGRDRSITAPFGLGKRNYNSIAGEAHWLDMDGRRRFATLDDVVQAAMLGQMLPRLNIVGAMSDPHEISVSHRVVEVVAAQLRTTTKPITFWFHDGPSAKFVVELMTAVAGKKDELERRPFAYPFLEPISPLRFARWGIDVLFETCEAPLPVSIGPMAQVGMSAPGTLAGTIAQETAEVLAGLCVVQLIHPGLPVCFGGIPHAFDMRTTQMIFAGPEQGLMAVAMTEMGKFYGLPVYINVGLTDSKTVDGQAGLESAATLLMGALAGADIFGHMGISGVDQASSLEMLVFQHEVIEYVERICRGFEVDDELLALDLIDQLGPGGTFIDQEHTVKHFREEVWMPTILDRQYWQQWEDAGRPDTAARAREKLRALLAAYKPCPLPDSVEKDVRRIVEDARRILSEHH